MKLIIHGDNIVASRNHLTESTAKLEQAGAQEIVRLDGEKLTEADLRQAIESQSLFGNQKAVVIEGLLSRRRSKEKDKLINIIAESPAKTSILFWDKKEVTKPNLNKLKDYTAQLFKTPASIFKFLDDLKPRNTQVTLSTLHNGLMSQPPELIFYMLSRRISDLIVASDPKADSLLLGAPWQKGKLKSQARNFSIKQLLSLHSQLLNIDQSIKTGKNLLPLSSQLDLLVTKL